MARGKLVFSSGLIDGGADTTLPPFDVSPYEALTVSVVYGDGDISRAISLNIYLPDGRTLLASPVIVTADINTTYVGHIGPGAASGSLTLDIPLPQKVGFTVPGTNGGDLHIYAWGR